jgi:hypothetical protein
MTRGFEQALYETTREAAVADIARRYRECVEIIRGGPIEKRARCHAGAVDDGTSLKPSDT